MSDASTDWPFGEPKNVAVFTLVVRQS